MTLSRLLDTAPLTPLYGGAFGRSAAADRAHTYSAIPEGTDILVTHGPPFGVLDRPSGTDRCDGCRELLAAVSRIQPRLHTFGHIHGGYGTYRANGTVFVNAALCGESEGIEQQPIVIDLEPGSEAGWLIGSPSVRRCS